MARRGQRRASARQVERGHPQPRRAAVRVEQVHAGAVGRARALDAARSSRQRLVVPPGRAGVPRPATARRGSSVDRCTTTARAVGGDGVDGGGRCARRVDDEEVAGARKRGRSVNGRGPARTAPRHEQADVVAAHAPGLGRLVRLERGRQLEVEARPAGAAARRRRLIGAPPGRRGAVAAARAVALDQARRSPGTLVAGQRAGRRCPRRGTRPGASRVRMSPGSTQ